MCRNSWRILQRLQNEIITFKTEDIDEYPTKCDLCSHGGFLQTLPQILLLHKFQGKPKSLNRSTEIFLSRRSGGNYRMFCGDGPEYSDLRPWSKLHCNLMIAIFCRSFALILTKKNKETQWLTVDHEKYLKFTFYF